MLEIWIQKSRTFFYGLRLDGIIVNYAMFLKALFPEAAQRTQSMAGLPQLPSTHIDLKGVEVRMHIIQNFDSTRGYRKYPAILFRLSFVSR